MPVLSAVRDDHELVAAADGTLNVRSRPGEGTTLLAEFPVSEL